jgi:butyryl-CoA dehydrogenase
MKDLKNKVVIVTGSGSGLGQALANRLSKEGCILVLNDINDHGLNNTKKEINESGGKASVHLYDLSQHQNVQMFCNEVIDKYGHVDVLINNAGQTIGRMKTYEISLKYWDLIMGINFWGALYCIKYFYPYLQKRPESHIVNISSIYSLMGAGNRGAYCASKFALRGLTESIIQETYNTSVGVTSVLPGAISTNIAVNSKGWKYPDEKKHAIEAQVRIARTSPQKAADKIVKAIKGNKRRIIIGWDARLLDVLNRLFPVYSGKLLHKFVIKGN